MLILTPFSLFLKTSEFY